MHPMNRTALLELAAKHTDPSPLATKMARRITSADDVASATHTLSRHALLLARGAAGLGAIAYLGFVIAACSGALLFVGASARYEPDCDPFSFMGIAGLLMLLPSTCLHIVAATAANNRRMQLDLLKPVVTVTDCERALKYIEAGRPEVLAWHALAVAERGVLAEFDVDVLRHIHYAATAASADEDACQRLYCRKDIQVSNPSQLSGS